MNDFERLTKQLADSPRVLLLGQRLLGRDDGVNPLLQLPGFELTGQSVFDACIGTKGQEVQANLDALGKALLIDERFDCVRRFPWRCIFTSSFDPIPFRLFNDQAKRPVISTFDSRSPDSNNLTLYRLFGATGRQSSSELPPSTVTELRNRRTLTSAMLTQIPRAVGPTGRLYIVGWHPGRNDWLRPRDLANRLYELTDEQILLFDLDDRDRESIEKDDDFQQLIDDGKARIYEKPFPDYLIEAESRGLSFVDKAFDAPDSIRISVRPHTPKDLEAPDEEELKSIVLSRQEYKRLTETF